MAAYDEHYQGAVQPIQLMRVQMSKEAFMGFLRGNIIKYASRLGKKDKEVKETAKILQYALWLHQTAQGEELKI
jgi:hypothetical protein